ncbi:hypothetical protein J6590_100782 [Homalodisca vitripennis]|nr:hypothetical protein J6590_100782 [Homalodisca vitripennis]
MFNCCARRRVEVDGSSATLSQTTPMCEHAQKQGEYFRDAGTWRSALRPLKPSTREPFTLP